MCCVCVLCLGYLEFGVAPVEPLRFFLLLLPAVPQ